MAGDLRIAIAGLGTVGTGVVKILQAHSDDIAKKAGRRISIVAVSSKDKNKRRDVDITNYTWANDAHELGIMEGVDVVVETIGGEGVAASLIETAIRNGRHVITANKALLAKRGYDLAQLAEDHGVSLNYEAAVAGGVPIIKALREGFAGNKINSVYGILNGTSNYILTEMRLSGRGFGEVLLEAQDKGYAEADPTFDIDGIDAAHKLSILTSLAFGVRSDFSKMDISGIRHITADDIAFAQELGFRIKLLGSACRVGDKIAQSLEACLVPIESPIGNVEGVYNAVFTEGDFVGNVLLEGRGAGEGPTASAILSDLVDLARGTHFPVFGVPVSDLRDVDLASDDEILNEQYLHMVAIDQPGVIADVSAILRDNGISIESLIQRGRAPGQPVSVIIMTHECSRAAIRKAAVQIAGVATITAPPTILRIERF
jgi:homoserine dehydrogenase